MNARHLLVAGLLLVLSGCSSSVSLQLAASGAFDAQQAKLAVSGVYLLDDGGSLVTLESQDAGAHNLLEFEDGNVVTLLSDTEVPEGHYVGLALGYDATPSEIVDAAGTSHSVSVPSALSFADIDFTVGKGDSASLWAGLDLRLSLSDQTASDGTFKLVPRLNPVDLNQSASLSGVISAALRESDECLQGRSTPDGAAVYAFPASDITPYDEYPAASPHPTATAAVTWNSDDTGSYAFPQLTPGTYTVALSCLAAEDDPLVYQGLAFVVQRDITLSAGESGSLPLN
jgi:hypothetical protein